MYFKNEIIDKIKIFSSEIKPSINYLKDLDNILITKIKNNIGNKCLKYGLVNKDSLKIVSRSYGYFNDGEFNASITYKVKCIADICNPNEGSFIECKIISINKMGLMGIIGDNINNSPLIILIPKQYHLKSNKFKDIKIGDITNIEVIGKKFEINDIYISIIGKIAYDNDNDILQDKVLDYDSEEQNNSNQIDSQSESFYNENQMNNLDDDLDMSFEKLNSSNIKKIINGNKKTTSSRIFNQNIDDENNYDDENYDDDINNDDDVNNDDDDDVNNDDDEDIIENEEYQVDEDDYQQDSEEEKEDEKEDEEENYEEN